MDTNKGNGWKVLLSLAMIAAIAVLPYLGMKWFGDSSSLKKFPAEDVAACQPNTTTSGLTGIRNFFPEALLTVH